MTYKTKVCLVCGEEYRPTGGSQRYCTECSPLVFKEQVRQWGLNHPEKRKSELAAKQKRAWQLANPEKVRATSRLWAKNHPEQKRAIFDAWASVNPGYSTLLVRKWRLANPERTKAHARKQDAKRRALGFTPLNNWFVGCEGHHINESDVIYLPHKLHRSIYHNQWTGKGMVEINALASAFLTEGEAQEENGLVFPFQEIRKPAY